MYLVYMYFEIGFVSYSICMRLNSNGRCERGVGKAIQIWEVLKPVESMQAKFMV